MNAQHIGDAEYAAALAAGRAESETEIRAQGVRYVPERDAIEIVTNRNAGFLIPRQWIGALQDVPTEELSNLEMWPDGSAMELEARDIHISVHGLLTASCQRCCPREPSLPSLRAAAAKLPRARSELVRKPTVAKAGALERGQWPT
jgi:hypothetical protein